MGNRMISYGYGINGSRICIIEKEADIVKRIFEEYCSGKLLHEIADSLTFEKVEFFLDNQNWNKNRISRIIENKKYIGEDGYPPMLSEELFYRAYNIKNDKGTKKYRFDENIEFLKKTVTCAQCGRDFRRISKWKTREKWICRNGCKNDIYIDDKEIFKEIYLIIDKIKRMPEILQKSKDEGFLQNQEIIKYKNELRRMLEEDEPNFNIGKQLIFRLAGLKFQNCHEDKQEAYTSIIMDAINNFEGSSIENNKDMQKIISSIQITKDGAIQITFINGAMISSEKEVKNAGSCEKDYNKDRRESVAI